MKIDFLGGPVVFSSLNPPKPKILGPFSDLRTTENA